MLATILGILKGLLDALPALDNIINATRTVSHNRVDVLPKRPDSFWCRIVEGKH